MMNNTPPKANNKPWNFMAGSALSVKRVRPAATTIAVPNTASASLNRC
jgi:hypothetical protein